MPTIPQTIAFTVSDTRVLSAYSDPVSANTPLLDPGEIRSPFSAEVATTTLTTGGGPRNVSAWSDPSAATTDSPGYQGHGTPFQTGMITDARMHELSGLAYSRDFSDAMYAHVDSGGVNIVWMIRESAAIRAELTMTGEAMSDWEDAAYNPADGRIYIADMGDNAGNRGNKDIFAFPEPSSVTTQSITPTQYPLTYPTIGGVAQFHDAECLMIHPSGDIYILTKAGAAPNKILFRFNAGSLVAGSANIPIPVASGDMFPDFVTGGDWHPGGRYVAVCTSVGDTIYILDSDNGYATVDTFSATPTTPSRGGGEALCWSVNGDYLMRGYDLGTDAPIMRIPINFSGPSGRVVSAWSDPASDTTVGRVVSQYSDPASAMTSGAPRVVSAWTLPDSSETLFRFQRRVAGGWQDVELVPL